MKALPGLASHKDNLQPEARVQEIWHEEKQTVWGSLDGEVQKLLQGMDQSKLKLVLKKNLANLFNMKAIFMGATCGPSS